MLFSRTKLSLGVGPAQSLAVRPVPAAPRRCGPVLVVARRGGTGLDPDTAALLGASRRGSSTIFDTSSSSPKRISGSSVEVDADADFMAKVKAAWRIFFPEKQRPLSPKEEGKKRLRMILVADRCGMSTDSLAGMRESIVKAIEDFVEVESEEAVEVNLSMDPEIGTIYSVAVPVRRVRPSLRPPMAEPVPGGATAWDPSDPDSDPSDQFPFGT